MSREFSGGAPLRACLEEKKENSAYVNITHMQALLVFADPAFEDVSRVRCPGRHTTEPRMSGLNNRNYFSVCTLEAMIRVWAGLEPLRPLPVGV